MGWEKLLRASTAQNVPPPLLPGHQDSPAEHCPTSKAKAPPTKRRSEANRDGVHVDELRPRLGREGPLPQAGRT